LARNEGPTANGRRLSPLPLQEEAKHHVGASTRSHQDCSVASDTMPPVLTAPPDIAHAECASSAGTEVDIGTGAATDHCCGADVTIANDAPGLFPLGTTDVTWTATDCNGLSDGDHQHVSVLDTTPPALDLAVAPGTLWPPNHRMVDVNATVTASDLCSTVQVTLVSLESDEPDNASGTGDGNTDDDVQGAEVGTADFGFALRAERDAARDGRTYTIRYTAADLAGNGSAAESSVDVPHDRGGQTDPVSILADKTAQGVRLVWDAVGGAAHYNVLPRRVRRRHPKRLRHGERPRAAGARRRGLSLRNRLLRLQARWLVGVPSNTTTEPRVES